MFHFPFCSEEFCTLNSLNCDARRNLESLTSLCLINKRLCIFSNCVRANCHRKWEFSTFLISILVLLLNFFHFWIFKLIGTHWKMKSCWSTVTSRCEYWWWHCLSILMHFIYYINATTWITKGKILLRHIAPVHCEAKYVAKPQQQQQKQQ